MNMPKIECFVLLQCLAPKRDQGHSWVYDMARVPKLGERIMGEELCNPGTIWKCRLVIKDPQQVAMLAAFDAIDKVSDQGDGFAVNFSKLLGAVVAGKRVI